VEEACGLFKLACCLIYFPHVYST